MLEKVVELRNIPESSTPACLSFCETPVAQPVGEVTTDEQLVGDKELVSIEELQKDDFGVEDSKNSGVMALKGNVITKEMNITIRKSLAKTILERMELEQKHSKEIFVLQALRAADKLVLQKAKDKEDAKKPMHVRLWEKITETAADKAKKSLQKVVMVLSILF